MSASCLKDSRPELEPTALRKAVTGGEGKGDAGDTDDLRGVVDFFFIGTKYYILGGKYFFAIVSEIYILKQFLPEKKKVTITEKVT